MPAPNEPCDPKQEKPSVDTTEQLEVNQTENDLGAVAGASDDLAGLLAEAQEQVAQYHDQLLRAKAEVENIRRRAQEDVARARKFGTESFAESLVPVKDSLEAALSQTDQTLESWREGVGVTLRQLSSAFERNALKEVWPAVGDKFDPHLHQAISSIPSDQPEGTVVQALQKGYTISDRVLRPALVTVSAGPGQAA
ncbi:MAG: nucleotide exchange factor GrpE [Candidimonas sp.]|nr:MAG: nucleotide exchange factor GrpE [Candidimonas sp.]TAM21086.1 MAG: nucleotide exchange factor GrpE [Candidimonas sp.]TAM80430.1 MAG: nucleotide exchange factor GrpE [Candidimonas sp.]